MGRVGAPAGAAGAAPDGVLHGSFTAAGHIFVCCEQDMWGFWQYWQLVALVCLQDLLYFTGSAVFLHCCVTLHLFSQCDCIVRVYSWVQLFAWREGKQVVYVTVCKLCDLCIYVLCFILTQKHRNIQFLLLLSSDMQVTWAMSSTEFHLKQPGVSA